MNSNAKGVPECAQLWMCGQDEITGETVHDHDCPAFVETPDGAIVLEVTIDELDALQEQNRKLVAALESVLNCMAPEKCGQCTKIARAALKDGQL